MPSFILAAPLSNLFLTVSRTAFNKEHKHGAPKSEISLCHRLKFRRIVRLRKIVNYCNIIVYVRQKRDKTISIDHNKVAFYLAAPLFDSIPLKSDLLKMWHSSANCLISVQRSYSTQLATSSSCQKEEKQHTCRLFSLLSQFYALWRDHSISW